MKNIKDITISIFAIIGFVAILSSFNNQSEPQETHSTVPETHIYEMYRADGSSYTFWLNKTTGDVRKYEASSKYYIVPTLKN